LDRREIGVGVQSFSFGVGVQSFSFGGVQSFSFGYWIGEKLELESKALELESKASALVESKALEAVLEKT
jgi:hypothetical protein